MKISSYGSNVVYGSQGTLSGISQQQGGDRVHASKRSGKKVGLKRVNYNYKEVSAALRRSGKSVNAAQVLVKARSKLSGLMRIKGTGQYEEAELAMAITHAKKMVDCAKMKVNNLKQEEMRQRRARQENMQDMKKKEKPEMVRREIRVKQEELERVILEQRMKAREREQNQDTKNHRTKENKKIDEADLEYLKHMIDGKYYISGGEADMPVGVLEQFPGGSFVPVTVGADTGTMAPAGSGAADTAPAASPVVDVLL